MAFWATCKIAQPIQPIWQHIFALPRSALKRPSWEFNFFHIFGIPSSSRHEKRCQMLQTLFWLLQCSKNPRWKNYGTGLLFSEENNLHSVNKVLVLITIPRTSSFIMIVFVLLPVKSSRSPFGIRALVLLLFIGYDCKNVRYFFFYGSFWITKRFKYWLNSWSMQNAIIICNWQNSSK